MSQADEFATRFIARWEGSGAAEEEQGKIRWLRPEWQERTRFART